ncbi:MAG: hypothetical protein KatS3mg113_0103 [Planctomycetaceae bacterium]|nr:MAG: hypothetical protein KatS3mg113_0103 [Planctomycetaceae bacterium]
MKRILLVIGVLGCFTKAESARAQGLLPLPGLRSSGGVEALLEQAEEAYQQGEFARCLELTNQIIQRHPQNHTALYLRASARAEWGSQTGDITMLRQGIEDARQALSYGGTRVVRYYLPYFYAMTNLAELEHKPQHAEVVVEFAGKVLARPDLENEDRANILYQRGRAYEVLDKPQEALKDYDQAVRIFPNQLAAQLNQAALLAALGRDAEAEAVFSSAIAQHRDDPTPYNNRGMFYQQRERYTLAKADFTQALQRDPTFIIAYINRAYTSLLMDQYAEAEADLTTALRYDPQHVSVYHLRGLVKLSAGKAVEALADFEQARRLQPQQPQFLADLGFAHFFAGNILQAAQTWETAVTQQPQLNYLDPWRYWALLRAGKRDQAQSIVSVWESQGWSPTNWPGQLLAFLASRIDGESLESAARLGAQGQPTTDQDPVSRDKLCEAYYFQALKLQQEGHTTAARDMFVRAKQTKRKHLNAYRGACYALGDFQPVK